MEPSFPMSSFLSIVFALGLILGFSRVSLALENGYKISHRKLVEPDPSCPLNFDVFRKMVVEGIPKPSFRDVPTQCYYVLEGLRVIRSEYLRTNGYFLPPSNTTKVCWESYGLLVSDLVSGFDIDLACGYHPEWVSGSCMNISSGSEFESLIPESKLQEVRCYCNQSLGNSTSCALCKENLASLQASYLGGSGIGNASDCAGYTFMYAAGWVNPYGPTDVGTAKCLFSLDFSPHHKRNKRYKILISGAVLGCVIGFFGAFAAAWFLWTRHRKLEREMEVCAKMETSLDSGFSSMTGSDTLVKFKFEEIKRVTMNFSRENIIGQGGYGNVYKGILPDGSEVALKRFKNCSAAGDAVFTHEVEVLASVRHMNLVALRGYCTATVPMEGHQRIIVCDLMPNGSLHDHLFGSVGKKLSWPIRQNIALGTARGLAYLHHGAQPAIIHRDIKASNILLDETFEAKVADFGLAKVNPEGITHLSTRVAGTLGYVAPEYALFGKLTERSDVYSFGVVLLELLSGKKALMAANGPQALLLTDWAWSLVKEGRPIDVVDEELPELGLTEVMERHVLIAVLCCHPVLESRPTMDKIVKMLETNLPIPSILIASAAL
ncbi:hypothetical protein PVL29_018155 [Vitis rotundifolia]|uniref:non-specific serine/threonine protein kinase n=1 Tax=Vitis rotundifolia TaxID=103349 RepID=A0AA38Z494_VITRO|nr:hypothetical protein PVL29_018155 [Vitis rotundifolia]